MQVGKVLFPYMVLGRVLIVTQVFPLQERGHQKDIRPSSYMILGRPLTNFDCDHGKPWDGQRANLRKLPEKQLRKRREALFLGSPKGEPFTWEGLDIARRSLSNGQNYGQSVVIASWRGQAGLLNLTMSSWGAHFVQGSFGGGGIQEA